MFSLVRRRDIISLSGVILVTGCAGNTTDQDRPQENVVVENVSQAYSSSGKVVSFDVNSTVNTTLTIDVIASNGSEIGSTQVPVTEGTRVTVVRLPKAQNGQISNKTIRFTSNETNINNKTEMEIDAAEVF
jgi:hypothetical protein